MEIGVGRNRCTGSGPSRPAPATALHALYLQLAPQDIALLKFLFESYEEVGLVRTIDRRAALIVVLVVPDFLATARALLDALRTEIACTEVAAPALSPDDWLMREIDGEP